MTDQSGTSGDPTRTSTRAVDILPAGTVLADRYRIEEVLGVGGMGMVYRAHDLQLDAEVAIKILHTDRQPGDETLARFRREVLLARKVSHPNVLRLHDIGQDGSLLFLSMDHVPGRTLREVLADGPMSVDQVVQLGSQVAGGLAAAHDKGVIHRDLKPGNILIDPDGNAHLLDFGIARAMDQEQITVAGQVVGTPAYLSPEQVRGEAATPASDIFTLGLILCEALTGRLPQSEGTLDELLGQRASGRDIDVSRLNPELPQWLAGILANCLAARPEQRYQDARQLKKDLEQNRSRTTRNRRFGKLAGLAVAAVVLVAALIHFLPTGDERPAADEPAMRVAILPVENATGRDTMNWIGRSMAQSMAETLAEIPHLEVTDSLRVFRLMEDLRLPPGLPESGARRQLFELLDVQVLIGGQLLATDDDYRVELTIFEPDRTQGQLIVSHGQPRDLMVASPEMSGEIVERLTGARVSPPLPPGTTNTEALDYFDQGTVLLARRETIAAAEAFERSVAADPQFSAAWTSLARTLAAAGRFDRAIDSAEIAARLLADHGGRLAMEAQATLAELEGQTEQAVRILEQLTEQYPGDTRARVRLAELLINQGRLDSAQDRLKEVVEREPQNAEAWFLLGRAAIMSGDPARASEDYLVRALVIENRTGSVQGRGDVVNALGIANLQLGNLTVAADYLAEAIDLREQAGDRRGTAATRANLAHLSMLLGEFDRAREQLQLAIEDRQALGDQAGMADLYNQQGVVAEEVGDYQAALESYREALRLNEALGHGRALADTYNNVAFAYLMLGRYDNARQFNRSALELLEAGERPRGRIMALETQGYLELARGDWEAALRAFLETLDMSRDLNRPQSEAVAHGGIGLVAAGQGRFGAARQSLESALDIVEEIDDLRGQRTYQLYLAELELDAGRIAAAGERLSLIESELGESTSTLIRTDMARLAGRHAAAAGKPEQAGTLLRTAREIASESDMAVQVLKADIELARLDRQADWSDTLLRAERAGHSLVLLDSLAAAGQAAMESDEIELAGQLARRALRPPNRIAPWHGNWRFHWLAAQSAVDGPDPAAMQAARAEVGRVLRELPDDWAADFRALLPDELRDVEIQGD